MCISVVQVIFIKKVIAINDDNDDNNTKKVCPTGCHCRHSAYVTVCV